MRRYPELERWFHWSRTHFLEDGSVGIHLDRLLSQEEVFLLPSGIELWMAFQVLLQEHQLAAYCGLVYSLNVIGTEPVHQVPVEKTALQLELSQALEPPTLYYSDLASGSEVAASQDIRIPMNALFRELELADVSIFYREFRTLQAVEENWEFSRCLYFIKRIETAMASHMTPDHVVEPETKQVSSNH